MVRILLLADTHLGFDLPIRPRVERRRRGEDFFANTRLALEPALRGEVDLVVHGGDLLYRSKVGAGLVSAALEPLLEVSDTGIPVFLVPGNHERSALPYPLLAAHQNLHLFDRPKTFELTLNGRSVAVSGLPCERKGVRDLFPNLVSKTSFSETAADIRLLCLHQTVEGARVEGYTFRRGEDIIRGRDIPSGFAAVLSGHIHRAQMLTNDLEGTPFAAPVIYPGSVERTSLAERDEPKGFFILEIGADGAVGGRLEKRVFHELPARPMFAVSVDVSGLEPPVLRQRLRDELAGFPPDSVVQLKIEGELVDGAGEEIRVARLRELYASTMTVELRYRPPRR